MSTYVTNYFYILDLLKFLISDRNEIDLSLTDEARKTLD